jgi:hypothetical protein
MKRRLTLAIGLSAMTALIGFGMTPAHAEGKGTPGNAGTPGKLARLAAEQSQAWEHDIATFPGLSPTTCVRSKLDHEVVMLPVLTGFVASPLAVSCTVGREDHLLLDVGGSILWEDAKECGTEPEPCYPVNGTPTPFRPDTLSAIASQVIADLSPFGQATLDGRTVKYRTLQTTFTLPVPTDAFNYADSEAVGHPGTLAAAYAGQKVLLDELRRGTHTILVHNNFGFDITYTITVR